MIVSLAPQPAGGSTVLPVLPFPPPSLPVALLWVYTAGKDRGSSRSLNEIVPVPSWGCGYSTSTERSLLCPGLGVSPTEEEKHISFGKYLVLNGQTL